MIKKSKEKELKTQRSNEDQMKIKAKWNEDKNWNSKEDG